MTTVNICYCCVYVRVTNYTTAPFILLRFRKRLNFRSVSQKIMDVFLQILEGNGHTRTQREGLCTGTAKSEPRYDIYLEQTAVYRYNDISLQP